MRIKSQVPIEQDIHKGLVTISYLAIFFSRLFRTTVFWWSVFNEQLGDSGRLHRSNSDKLFWNDFQLIDMPSSLTDRSTVFVFLWAVAIASFPMVHYKWNTAHDFAYQAPPLFSHALKRSGSLGTKLRQLLELASQILNLTMLLTPTIPWS